MRVLLAFLEARRRTFSSYESTKFQQSPRKTPRNRRFLPRISFSLARSCRCRASAKTETRVVPNRPYFLYETLYRASALPTRRIDLNSKRMFKRRRGEKEMTTSRASTPPSHGERHSFKFPNFYRSAGESGIERRTDGKDPLAKQSSAVSFHRLRTLREYSCLPSDQYWTLYVRGRSVHMYIYIHNI